MHLYEGFIGCDEKNLWQTGLHFIGWWESKSVEVSDGWKASARTLLDRIFQEWTLSDQQSTKSLCEQLKAFIWSFGSAHERVVYADDSRPLWVKVGSLQSHTSVYLLLVAHFPNLHLFTDA